MTIVIFGLPYDWTTSDVRELCAVYGPLESVSMPPGRPGRTCGMAFVTFANADDASRALCAIDGGVLGGYRRLRCEYARPRRTA